MIGIGIGWMALILVGTVALALWSVSALFPAPAKQPDRGGEESPIRGSEPIRHGSATDDTE